MAGRLGAETFELTPKQLDEYQRIFDSSGREAADAWLLGQNYTWLMQKVKEGATFVDIGVDVNRTTRSQFYMLERSNLKVTDDVVHLSDVRGSPVQTPACHH
jgi:hypothetical protein